MFLFDELKRISTTLTNRGGGSDKARQIGRFIRWFKVKYISLKRNIITRFNPIKISFIIVGAQKSGTTALYHFLSQHPELSLSVKKETNFFYVEWTKDGVYDEYEKYFKTHLVEKKYGEASPLYLVFHDLIAPRIAKYNPKVKLIIILRNPIERAFSAYRMHVKKHNLKLSFDECLDIAFNHPGKEMIFDDKTGFTINLKSFVDLGHYVKQIKSFQNYFDPNQILFLRTEDLRKEHHKTMEKVFDFLNVEYVDVKPSEIHSFKGEVMLEESKMRLLKEFANEISKLEKLLGWDLSQWRDISSLDIGK